MNRRTDRQVDETSEFLSSIVSINVADAREHLRREQQLIDGFVARGEGGGRGRSETSTTEAAAMQWCGFANEQDDLEDAVRGLKIAASHVNRTANKALGMRAPVETPRCKEAQNGKDAGLWSDDLRCQALPHKAGLCAKHYTAWYRHRVAQGIDTTHDFEPA